jgi:signal transduction histidine kinase
VRIIFDKIHAPTSPGWHKTTTLKEEKVLLLYTELKEGYALMVAADLDGVTEMEHAVRNSFLLTSFFTLLLSIAGGVMVSNRFLIRVDQLKQTASNIGRGNLSERIPLAGTGDDFDQLTLTINQMLDRMELLMGDVRNVSTSIAHDLRTPLAKLRQKLEHLQQLHEEPDTSYKLCTEAIALLDETLETFSALLRIAEIESGGSRANFTTIDFSALLSHLAETYAPVVEDHAQTLSTYILPDIHIKGDKSLLTQLFANLIENAYKHAGTGAAIQLVLSQEKGHIIAVVSDNGVGIPASAYEHITKPFYRLDRSRHTKGSGLGLSMVAAIVSLHGAKLVLDDNQPGLKVEIMFTE